MGMGISYLLAKILKKVHIPAIRDSFIHRSSKIGSFTHVVNVSMGRYSYAGSNCTLLDVEIGAFCSISDNVVIGGRSHPVDWVSTSPVFHKGRNIMRTNFSLNEYNCIKKTTIGNDVWIGSNSLIKSGVTINSGAVIGMGSVVTKDIGPYEIWAGNPAKLIRKRFGEEEIKVLLMSRWWEWSDCKIKENSHLICDPQGFLDSCTIMVSKK